MRCPIFRARCRVAVAAAAMAVSSGAALAQFPPPPPPVQERWPEAKPPQGERPPAPAAQPAPKRPAAPPQRRRPCPARSGEKARVRRRHRGRLQRRVRQGVEPHQARDQIRLAQHHLRPGGRAGGQQDSRLYSVSERAQASPRGDVGQGGRPQRHVGHRDQRQVAMERAEGNETRSNVLCLAQRIA